MAKAQTYKYTSNKDIFDGTQAFVLDDGTVVNQGDTVELTDDQVSSLRERFNLRESDKETSATGEGTAEAGPEASGPSVEAESKSTKASK